MCLETVKPGSRAEVLVDSVSGFLGNAGQSWPELKKAGPVSAHLTRPQGQDFRCPILDT